VPKKETGSFPLADDDRLETAADMGIDGLQCPDGFRGRRKCATHPFTTLFSLLFLFNLGSWVNRTVVSNSLLISLLANFQG
jgi:hypothetical protein